MVLEEAAARYVMRRPHPIFTWTLLLAVALIICLDTTYNLSGLKLAGFSAMMQIAANICCNMYVQ
jgi:hypothetical protein